jgi:hypothetical protein
MSEIHRSQSLKRNSLLLQAPNRVSGMFTICCVYLRSLKYNPLNYKQYLSLVPLLLKITMRCRST